MAYPRLQRLNQLLIAQLQRVQEEREHDIRELQARISYLEGREKALMSQVAWTQDLLKRGKGEDVAIVLHDNNSLQERVMELEGKLAAKEEEAIGLWEKLSDTATYTNTTRRSTLVRRNTEPPGSLQQEPATRSNTQPQATRSKSQIAKSNRLQQQQATEDNTRQQGTMAGNIQQHTGSNTQQPGNDTQQPATTRSNAQQPDTTKSNTQQTTTAGTTQHAGSNSHQPTTTMSNMQQHAGSNMQPLTTTMSNTQRTVTRQQRPGTRKRKTSKSRPPNIDTSGPPIPPWYDTPTSHPANYTPIKRTPTQLVPANGDYTPSGHTLPSHDAVSESNYSSIAGLNLRTPYSPGTMLPNLPQDKHQQDTPHQDTAPPPISIQDSESPPLSPFLQDGSPSEQQVQIRWQPGQHAGDKMVRGATVYNRVTGEIYFSCSRSAHVYSYHPESALWSRLHPSCPNNFYGLALVRGQVTAIGGQRGANISAQVLTLVDMGEEVCWVEELPPMPTPRFNVTTVTTRGGTGAEKVIAIGGVGKDGPSQCVEVLHMMKRQWSHLANLPGPIDMLSAVTAGKQLYLLGGTNDRTVYTCFLPYLMRTTEEQTGEVWFDLVATPTYSPTGIIVGKELLAVGGYDKHGVDTTSIFHFQQYTRTWKIISNMNIACNKPLVANLPRGKLMVVGGSTKVNGMTTAVQTATVTVTPLDMASPPLEYKGHQQTLLQSQTL